MISRAVITLLALVVIGESVSPLNAQDSIGSPCDEFRERFCAYWEHAVDLERRWQELDESASAVEAPPCTGASLKRFSRARAASERAMRGWLAYYARWLLATRGRLRHFRADFDQHAQSERRLRDGQAETPARRPYEGGLVSESLERQRRNVDAALRNAQVGAGAAANGLREAKELLDSIEAVIAGLNRERTRRRDEYERREQRERELCRRIRQSRQGAIQ